MRSTRYRRMIRLVIPLLAVLAGTTAILPSAQAAEPPPNEVPCAFTYTFLNDPPSPFHGPRFTGRFIITNNNTVSTAAWTLRARFQPGVEVTQFWGVRMLVDADPNYVFGNANWNARLGPGQSIEVGVVANKTSDAVSAIPRPTSFCTFTW